MWCLHACAVWPNGFALRSHVNGIVGTCADRQNSSQIPRIYVSLFPHGPTAHAQTMKKKPQTLASPEVHEKTHCIEIKLDFFLITNLEWSLVTSGTCVRSEWHHALFFFTTLVYKINIGCLLLGGRSHKQWMRPSNGMNKPGSWPWLD